MSEKKTVSTVVVDIEETIQKIIDGTEVDIPAEYLEQFKTNVSEAIVRQLTPRTSSRKEKVLYFSEVGKQCGRALWYAHNGGKSESISPDNKIKFMYGDILEEFLILLIKVAGHDVTEEQKQVVIPLHDGWELRGRIDFKIDGTLIDAKSASTFAFKKFSEGKLITDDPFGYMAQLAGYAMKETSMGAPGFLAIDKQHGKLALFQPTKTQLAHSVPDAQMLVHTIELPDPPPRYYDDKPYGKSGNHALEMDCSFCNYRKECWKESNSGAGLRSFQYADGRVVHFTQLAREPNLKEV